MSELQIIGLIAIASLFAVAYARWPKPSRRAAVVVGGRYRLIGQAIDPWGLTERCECTVVDVRDGWVRYRFRTSTKDETLPEARFINCYARIANAGVTISSGAS